MTRFRATLFAVVVSLLALLASPTACEGGYVDCQIDDTYTEHQASEIERAAEAVSDFTGRSIRVSEDADWLILPAKTVGGWGGQTQGSRRILRISPTTPDDKIYGVALHEISHILKLRHICRPPDPKPGEPRVLGPVADDAPPCDPPRSMGVMDPLSESIVFSEADHVECLRAGHPCP